ncbi:hypothetical protein CLOP_g7641, partial [Closterium sp. NIES-67]
CKGVNSSTRHTCVIPSSFLISGGLKRG